MTAASRPRLVVRLPNWVGDVCMALPTLAALAAAGLDLRLVGRGWAGDLLAGQGWPIVKVGPGLRGQAAALRLAAGDAADECAASGALLFTNSLSSALAARWAGLRPLGFRGDGRWPLLHRSLPRPTAGHEVERGWSLGLLAASECGLTLPAAPPPSLGLRPGAAHFQAAQQALVRAGITGPYLVLAPLAAGTIAGRSKCWPGFPLLCRLLREAGPAVVTCPGPGEDATTAAAAPGAIPLPGLGLGAYAALCAGAVLTVANDSGPMHLAAAVDAPVLGLFGVSDPRRTQPWGPGARHLGGVAEGDEPAWPAVDAVRALVQAMLAAPTAGAGSTSY